MKKKDIAKLRESSADELYKEAKKIENEIANLRLEAKVNPPKDSNMAIKKRNRLAVLLTIISDKEMIRKSSKS